MTGFDRSLMVFNTPIDDRSKPVIDGSGAMIIALPSPPRPPTPMPLQKGRAITPARL
ncbi:hypothetical protein PGT21_029454 [Puccinia graminis f. sp. tritici]|uniref:Uncharacterized protein n=1 Tax=Puccinia graminis f. sp. tritici TaxID=56615 RepID=A0A5B0PUY0_PUCGR|nr:hypothetical protein PGT21_029454 [Puccinia graminis f. sp. tritici]KAA1122658.1 hypothetical protein PGTUg99_002379 [Puccinia graminis f. sp. tritici]